MQRSTINYEDLCQLGFRPHQARDIIKEAKARMVTKGYSLYLNKRLGVVPRYVVAEIIGIPLEKEGFDDVKH